MSIVIDASSFEAASADAKLQLVPCRIEHNGDAKVASFFTPAIREESTSSGQVYTASFRGRPLKGQRVPIPAGYSGVVLKEHRKPFSEDEDRQLKVTHKFQEYTQWNLDAAPSVNDKCVRAMHWLDIAKAIHGSVDEESSQKSTVGK